MRRARSGTAQRCPITAVQAGAVFSEACLLSAFWRRKERAPECVAAEFLNSGMHLTHVQSVGLSVKTGIDGRGVGPADSPASGTALCWKMRGCGPLQDCGRDQDKVQTHACYVISFTALLSCMACGSLLDALAEQALTCSHSACAGIDKRQLTFGHRKTKHSFLKSSHYPATMIRAKIARRRE